MELVAVTKFSGGRCCVDNCRTPTNYSASSTRYVGRLTNRHEYPACEDHLDIAYDNAFKSSYRLCKGVLGQVCNEVIDTNDYFCDDCNREHYLCERDMFR